jgi:2-C-methyl-D-erythritol 2,4-cyclodiphosphate synthase
MLGGIEFENHPALEGNSDADVVLHALTNAISGVTCVNIIGACSDKLCLQSGITDSSVYLLESIKYLNGLKIIHISISIECLSPKISGKIEKMRTRISELLSLPTNCIGITATTGEGLTQFGQGMGIQCFCIITVM